MPRVRPASGQHPRTAQPKEPLATARPPSDEATTNPRIASPGFAEEPKTLPKRKPPPLPAARPAPAKPPKETRAAFVDQVTADLTRDPRSDDDDA
jgi:hypothetical protein